MKPIGLTNKNNGINLKNYTKNSPYMTTSNGYAEIGVTANNGGNGIHLLDKNGNDFVILWISDKPNASHTVSVYVPKGVYLYADNPTYAEAFFIPFIYQ